MEKRRSAAGASVLALMALVVSPVAMFLATGDLVLSAVGGAVVGFVAAYLILLVAMTTCDCTGYIEGLERLYTGGEAGGAGGLAGWAMTALSLLAAVGIVVRIWRSDDPLRSALVAVGVVVAALAASFALVAGVMAFGDLVDWLLRKRRR